MKTKPLARWTIGPVSKTGVSILINSVKRFQKIYPEIDTLICYNNFGTKPAFLDHIASETYCQSQAELAYPIDDPDPNPQGGGMRGSGWKMSPPRLRINAPEIWLDNDIMIWNRMPTLDRWLADSSGALIAEGVHRLYGIYQDFVPLNEKLCAGFFALPPFFDFNKSIMYYANLLQGTPIGHYNEQGLVAATIANMLHRVVPLNELANCHKLLPTKDASGFHFIGANRTNNHQPWNDFCRLYVGRVKML